MRNRLAIVWSTFLLAMLLAMACNKNSDSGPMDSGLDGISDASEEDGADTSQGADGDQNADADPACDPSITTEE